MYWHGAWICTALPHIVLIVDPDDDLACLEELRRLHARPFGQILCEPDPIATSAELARYLLHALGKHSEPLTRGQLGTQVDCHLRAERVRQLAVTRAHTLTYQALKDLADHAHNAGSELWLLIAAERPTGGSDRGPTGRSGALGLGAAQGTGARDVRA